MSKVEAMLREIEVLRMELGNAIREKKNLLDPHIIKESQKLDLILNEYNKMLKKKISKLDK